MPMQPSNATTLMVAQGSGGVGGGVVCGSVQQVLHAQLLLENVLHMAVMHLGRRRGVGRRLM